LRFAPFSNDDVVATGSVFRLAPVRVDEIFRVPLRPKAQDFEFSNADRAAAKHTGVSRLTVWDASLTAPTHVAVARGVTKPTLALGLEAARVWLIPIPGTNETLKVVRDPSGGLPDIPAEAHCAILGLGEEVCPRKADRASLRDELAQIAKVLELVPPPPSNPPSSV
jgi:hypothetical protein